jgi:phosphatidylinositol alpha-1,6-mannosyltransferase
MQRLRDLADQHSVSENVSFIGYVKDEQLDQLYNMSDLFVMPSTGEGFGIVYLEAMAHGVPALGLNEDGSVDPLQDGQLGIVATKETLCDEIINALNTKTDASLSTRVQAVFGKQYFNQHVSNLVSVALSTTS